MFHQIILTVLTVGLDMVEGGKLSLAVQGGQDRALWKLTGLREDAVRRMVKEEDRLAVSRGLLEVYGGRLWIDADPVLALCFSIPYSEPSSLLIIDDDLEAIELYRRYLQDQAWLVRSARDSSELVSQLDTFRPDLILLDVLMPEEDGWELLQRLKTLPDTRDIPVVICSVLSQPDLALSLGASCVLQKPIAEETLIETIQATVSER